MFHDVQFFPGAVHAPLADLKTLPKDVKEKMSLIHYADDYKKQDILSGTSENDFCNGAPFTIQGCRYIFD